MDSQAIPLSRRLREVSRSHHADAYQLPFFEALQAGTLQPTSYVGQLRGLAIIHGVVERELARAPEALDGIRRVYRPRLPSLLNGLAVFSVLDHPDVVPATAAALEVADRALHCSSRDPIELVGFVYALEGSIHGTRVLRPRYEETLRLAGQGGTSYLDGHGEESRERWRLFTAAVDEVGAGLDEPRTAAVLSACHDAFTGIMRMLRALHPLPPKTGAFHVTSLNPEAGCHVMTQDPLAIKASIVASRAAWKRFPYLAARYGERGWRFTLSDGAWLATMMDHGEGTAAMQVEWLAALLARRGLPRIVLEVHLRLLSETLAEALPERREACDVLGGIARRMREAREAVVSPARARWLAEDFARGAPPGEEPWKASLAEIVLSAVTDEAGGLDGTLAALVSWVLDPIRSDGQWSMRVGRLITRAGGTLPGHRAETTS